MKNKWRRCSIDLLLRNQCCDDLAFWGSKCVGFGRKLQFSHGDSQHTPQMGKHFPEGRMQMQDGKTRPQLRFLFTFFGPLGPSHHRPGTLHRFRRWADTWETEQRSSTSSCILVNKSWRQQQQTTTTKQIYDVLIKKHRCCFSQTTL